MQLILKYHGELTVYFPHHSEDHSAKLDIGEDDTVYNIIESFNIPRDKINLILVNGVKVNHDDCDRFRFSDGDTLAVWPVA